MPAVDIIVKQCPRCGETKSLLAGFYKDRSRKTGHESACKDCRVAYQKSARGAEVYRAAAAKYRSSEHGKAMTLKHNQSDGVKTAKRRYKQSEAGKASASRYNSSDKGRAAWYRYYKSEKGQIASKLSTATYANRYPEKVRARSVVDRLKKAGKLIVPDRCEQCGTEGKVHGHHEDYNKPSVVNWLCVKCHTSRHTAAR